LYFLHFKSAYPVKSIRLSRPEFVRLIFTTLKTEKKIWGRLNPYPVRASNPQNEPKLNMKTTKSFSKILKTVAFLMVAGILFSCQDDGEEAVTEEEEIQIANESSSSESVTDEELQAIEEELILNPEGGRIAGSGCATVTWNSEAKTVTLDFGDGCVGVYGRERSGKIIITYGGEFGDHLANRVITFDNYFVNNKQITGSIELRDFNHNDDGDLTATRKRIDLTVHYPDGNTFTSNGSITVTWTEGGADQDLSNDVLTITGAYTGVSSRGRVVTHTIIDPVIVSYACYANGGFARIGGKTELRITGARERVRVVDYGDGTCDDTVVVTINGKVYTIIIS
jgi:hypothetical protein